MVFGFSPKVTIEDGGLVESLEGEGGAVRPRVSYEEIQLEPPIRVTNGAQAARVAPHPPPTTLVTTFAVYSTIGTMRA